MERVRWAASRGGPADGDRPDRGGARRAGGRRRRRAAGRAVAPVPGSAAWLADPAGGGDGAGLGGSSVYGWAAAWRGGDSRGSTRASRGRGPRWPHQARPRWRNCWAGPAVPRPSPDRLDGAAAASGVGAPGTPRANIRCAAPCTPGLALETPPVRVGTPRPGLRRKKGGIAQRAAAMLEAGGEVWVGDETAVREYPPLRAAWSRRGEQATEVDQRAQRPTGDPTGAQLASGELVTLVRPAAAAQKSRGVVRRSGNIRPDEPKLLLWDNAPAHHPKSARGGGWSRASSWPACRSVSPELKPWRTSGGASRRSWPPTAATRQSNRRPPDCRLAHGAVSVRSASAGAACTPPSFSGYLIEAWS